jgi:hypothetical protein
VGRTAACVTTNRRHRVAPRANSRRNRVHAMVEAVCARAVGLMRSPNRFGTSCGPGVHSHGRENATSCHMGRRTRRMG